MPEEPKYESVPTTQYRVYRDGVHVGYRVSLLLQKGTTRHEEAVDVIVGAEQASALAFGSVENFTAWYNSQLEEHELVEKANAYLDGL